MKRENSVLILRALLMGMVIVKDNNTYCMDEGFNVCQVRTKGLGTFNVEQILLPINFGEFKVAHFVKWCNSFTIDEIAIINCDIVLNTEKPKRKICYPSCVNCGGVIKGMGACPHCGSNAC